MPLELQIVNLDAPHEERRFPYGRFEVFTLGGLTIGRATYDPGWRWSEHVGPAAGTAWCEVEHVGLVLSGRAAVKMRDEEEVELGPGDLFSIPGGHDSWVLGDDAYISLHLLGAEGYATPAEATVNMADEAPCSAVSKTNNVPDREGAGLQLHTRPEDAAHLCLDPYG
jgi:mannose-6-phosphate isomerase-like protein (cupin superfamily)